ncbi:dihydrofolate reductase [Aurantimonas sp. DM33-3]|uniref:dihydrofolate reductase n=1 Tax=Aurantimonas sp. DM33-3 TaxID=2766955 RepID=UPI001651EE69|nr:dihydrofolate reductase [Aurantimonas sp. DM33-3]MBC6717215.1 dihydrofolate reductase [Aurantimonas sp. DM33-3]
MAVKDPALVAVVAMAENGVIGDAGAMPWRMPSDLKRYRRLTMGKPMIMGRKTLDSIGRVLDGRDSIVLSRAEQLPYEGAILAGTPDAALGRARDAAAAREADEIVVAGGAEIYRLFLDRLDRLYVTRIAVDVSGDTVFPPIDPAIWAVESDEPCERGPKDSADSRFIVYVRRDR